ncbi:MAG: prepilin-type N-terminal cleavage/methylation domain-containing protein [Planctomycetes bacterium]|nr:prepilin-type N-terminal cleavage/methylation domain-containing protein [Planctomycetota bacterium]
MAMSGSFRRMSAGSKFRGAFTLMEMILVMTLIVILAALVVPSIRGFYKGEKLMAATDGVRAAAAQARLMAIDYGIPYRLSVVPGRGNYRAAPDTDEAWVSGQGGELPTVEGVVPPDIALRVQTQGQNLSISDEGEVATAFEVGKVSADMWTTVAVFRPDGTADRTVEIICSSAHSLPLSITLRGLTGTTSVRRLGPGQGTVAAR